MEKVAFYFIDRKSSRLFTVYWLANGVFTVLLSIINAQSAHAYFKLINCYYIGIILLNVHNGFSIIMDDFGRIYRHFLQTDFR